MNEDLVMYVHSMQREFSRQMSELRTDDVDERRRSQLKRQLVEVEVNIMPARKHIRQDTMVPPLLLETEITCIPFDVQPVEDVVQLPIRLYKIYKKKRIEAILYYMDSEQGWRSMRNPGGDNNMKPFACIEVIWPTPPTENADTNGPYLYSTPTRALKDWQQNTENGWAALKNMENDKPLKLHGVAFGGQGFRNPPFATTLHRDILAMFTVDKRVTRYYHDKKFLHHLKTQVDIEEVLDFLCQDKPHVRQPGVGVGGDAIRVAT